LQFTFSFLDCHFAVDTGNTNNPCPGSQYSGVDNSEGLPCCRWPGYAKTDHHSSQGWTSLQSTTDSHPRQNHPRNDCCTGTQEVKKIYIYIFYVSNNIENIVCRTEYWCSCLYEVKIFVRIVAFFIS
jgi:hypothetical protein